ncbi:alanine racemase [Limibacter armeniacum]|uniref:alanine racemase n=1 Tax=Limibacter armeniacum TaxID=466084 RepID=UPI002FE61E8D
MINKPTLLLDEGKCRSNIHQMVSKARRNNVILRPHFKTHQSHEIGQWFREEGIDKITVSSLTMAQYFAQDGWNDITVAFPTNILEIETINELAKKITLRLVVESLETVTFLAKHLTAPIHGWIKIDAGYHRTGISATNYDGISALMFAMDDADKITLDGFLLHAGHSYACRSKEAIIDIHHQSIEALDTLKKHFDHRYPPLKLSLGDTPTCSVAEDFSLVDEIRPGNFVFYDVTQSQIGSCALEQIAIAMACPVVAIHKDRNEVIVYGGSVHFSKDTIDDNGVDTFGVMVETKSNGWGDVIHGAYMKKLSQEHGTIHMPSEKITQIKVGDIVTLLPVHACTTSNLMRSYQTTADERHIARMSSL